MLEISGNEQYKANPNAIQPNQEVKLQAPQAQQLAQKAATEKQAQEAAQKLQQETAAQQLAQKAEEAKKKAEEDKKATEAATQQAQAPAQSHEVKEGDTLSAIAQAQGKSVDELLSIPSNEQFKANPDAIKPGDTVHLFSSENKDQSGTAKTQQASKNEGSTATKSDNKSNDTHHVEKGETLSEIAHDNNTTVEHLAKDNNISNPDHIEAGQDISMGGEDSSRHSSDYPS